MYTQNYKYLGLFWHELNESGNCTPDQLT